VRAYTPPKAGRTEGAHRGLPGPRVASEWHEVQHAFSAARQGSVQQDVAKGGVPLSSSGRPSSIGDDWIVRDRGGRVGNGWDRAEAIPHHSKLSL
jgi:hypothetical protein